MVFSVNCGSSSLNTHARDWPTASASPRAHNGPLPCALYPSFSTVSSRSPVARGRTGDQGHPRPPWGETRRRPLNQEAAVGLPFSALEGGVMGLPARVLLPDRACAASAAPLSMAETIHS